MRKAFYGDGVAQKISCIRKVGIVCAIADDNVGIFRIDRKVIEDVVHALPFNIGIESHFTVFQEYGNPMNDAELFCIEIEDFKPCHIEGIFISITAGKLVAGPFFGKVDVFRTVKPQTVIIVRAADAEGWRFNDVVGTMVDKSPI